MMNFQIVDLIPSNKYIILASEKLSESPHWQEIPEQNILSMQSA